MRVYAGINQHSVQKYSQSLHLGNMSCPRHEKKAEFSLFSHDDPSRTHLTGAIAWPIQPHHVSGISCPHPLPPISCLPPYVLHPFPTLPFILYPLFRPTLLSLFPLFTQYFFFFLTLSQYVTAVYNWLDICCLMGPLLSHFYLLFYCFGPWSRFCLHLASAKQFSVAHATLLVNKKKGESDRE